MSSAPDDLTPERRASLAAKGRLLYRKYCGTSGRGICAESFAVYHISRGEAVTAADLADYLDAEAEAMETDDPHGRLASTRGLAARIRQHLATGDTSEPREELPRAGWPLRLFVLGNAINPAGCELEC